MTDASDGTSGWLTCSWCHHQSPAGERTCLTCGAPLDQRDRVVASGWREAPVIPDLASFGFGHGSSCQVAGQVVPVADLSLADTDRVYFEPHTILWSKDVDIEPVAVKGASDRRIAGLPWLLTAASGPGHLACSHHSPGELVVLPMPPGWAIEVRENSFLLASAAVRYGFGYFEGTTGQPGRGYSGDSGGNYLDRFVTVDDPGLLIVHGYGNVFERTLAEGETITIRPGGFLYKDATVTVRPLDRVIKPGMVKRRLWQMEMTGPGRVGLQSMYFQPPDNSSKLSG